MSEVWSEVEGTWARLRGELEAHGVRVAAPLVRGEGVLSGWREGVVYIAPTSLETPGDALRATVHGAMMGLSPEAAARLFRAMIPRVVGHELGHAARAAAGRLSADHLVEETAADRLGAILMRRHTAPAVLAEARETFAAMSTRLGAQGVSAGLHRHAAQAREALGLSAPDDAIADARARFQREYYSDVVAYLRLFATWQWIDLSLDADGDLAGWCATLGDVRA
jgi:hypothetical protein